MQGFVDDVIDALRRSARSIRSDSFVSGATDERRAQALEKFADELSARPVAVALTINEAAALVHAANGEPFMATSKWAPHLASAIEKIVAAGRRVSMQGLEHLVHEEVQRG